jgi:hypothetical protein
MMMATFTPGAFVGFSSSDPSYIYSDTSQHYQQLAQAQMGMLGQGYNQQYAIATTNTATATNWSNSINLGGLIGGWGSVGQKDLPAPVKKALSFLETLREEISAWHGSLGTI